MAKARYPCRSRLLISSRDTDIAGSRSITVRMHHHVSHEPYVDGNIHLGSVYSGWEGHSWPEHRESPFPTPRIQCEPVAKSNDQVAIDTRDDDGDSDGEGSSPGDMHGPVDESNQEDASLPVPPVISEHSQHPPPLIEKYHTRMKTHITNLREFCEELEFQLQFNDYRMLDVLEQEGGSFLNLVADCLKKEGRLAIPDQLHSTLLDTGQPLREHTTGMPSSAVNSQRPYDGTQGINPRALND